MSGQRALEVVARTGGHFVQQDIAEDIVRSVAGAGSDSAMADLEVEPALLSILCRELNEERKARVLPMITRDLVALSSSEILRDFYEASVSRVGRASRRFIEEQLVNTSGFRHAVPLETALDTPEVTRQDLDY